MSRIVVTGSASGLGKCICRALKFTGHYVIPYDIRNGDDVLQPRIEPNELSKGVDVLINCAGIVRLDWLRCMSSQDWDAVMDTNVKGIFRMTQHLLPELKRSFGTVLNIVSSAAHMPMRTSAAYNASKAAALMLTRQMARELAPDITVFSVSPNRLKGTGMSKLVDTDTASLRGWTKDEVTEKQLSASLIGEETPPDQVADLIAFLLSSKERHKYLTGCDIPYGV